MSFAVVVAVNDEAKFRGNVLASFGLGEINAAVIPVRWASSAADAFDRGARLVAQSKLERVRAAEWILFCHQDVYFPEGSGKLLEAILADIPASLGRSMILGFIGLDRDGQLVGLVNDRGTWLRGPECAAAVSVDELAVVLHRDSRFRLDAALGWHWWATDLCLQALEAGLGGAQVLQVPLVHNSTLGGAAPPEFWQSARTLLAKYPQRDQIRNLNVAGGVLHREACKELPRSCKELP